ncbi:MAG TPA: TonB-dependent receptor [Bryobacteraceae bacterium]|jgi:hypothetical protein
MKFKTAFLTAFLTFLVFIPSRISAQAVSGDLTGAILDATGAAIPNATVTAQNDATGAKTTVPANNNGVYHLTNLPVGTYTLAASATGFATGTAKNLKVELNNTLTQNMTLVVGNTATTVEVTSAPAALDTTTAQLQTTFESNQIQNVPATGLSKVVNGAGIWNLSLLGAGVTSSGGVGQGTGPSIAGQRPENNTFFIDGVSNNDYNVTGPLVYISNDAVMELSLLQNQFSAEFGGASGGVFNAIVKSGTNQVHGSVYEYFQNRNLNAVDSLNVNAGLRSNPRYDNNRLGASIGGPILKDKLFYFGDFEYNPIGQASVPKQALFAPTEAGYSILNGLPGLSKNNLSVLEQYVSPAPVADQSPVIVNGATIPVGSLSTAGPSYSNSYNAIVSIDYNLSDSDQIRGRYISNNVSQIDINANLPAFYQPEPTRNKMVTLSEFHNFSPTMQNEFRASFSRNYNTIGAGDFKFPGLDVFPNITIDDLNSIQIGPDPNTPTGSIQNLLQGQDNLIKTAGRHTIKVGYSFTDVILTNYFIQRVRGDYEYKTLGLYLNDLSPDVLGERSAGSSDPCGFLMHAAYINDDFRIRTNFTLNLGLRYEYVTIPVASRTQGLSAAASIPGPGGISFAEPRPSPNEWSPRIGFAYSPGNSGVWSIRGGFSRSYDLTYANLTANAAPAFFLTTQDVPSLSVNTPNFLAGGGLTGGSGGLPTDIEGIRAAQSTYVFGDKRPYGLTWTLGVQRSFGSSYTAEVRYTGTKGVHLWNQSRLNIVSPVTASLNLPTFFSMPSAATLAGLKTTLGDLQALPNNKYEQFGIVNNLTGYAPQAYSSYHGLATQLTKRFSNNLSFIAAYTWSHMHDDATATNFSTYLTPRRAQDFQDLRSEWASSALDRRHRFTFTSVYDFRIFRNSNWFLKNVVSNWNLSGTYTYESPEYATVQSGVDSNLNGDSAGDRAVINLNGVGQTGTGVTGYNTAGQAMAAGDSSIVAYVADNPTARYVVAGEGALPNGGRNTLPLHPINNVDFSLLKRINFTESIRFEFGSQFFNVFNHPQVTGGYLSDVSLNSVTTARNELIPSDPLFGNFDKFYSNNARQLQLVARFVF